MSSIHWAWVSVTSRCHTWLKRHPVDVNKLPVEEKAQVMPSRSILRCKVLDRQDEHTKLDMRGLGDWWVLDSHWNGLAPDTEKKPYSVEGDLIFLKDFPYYYQESDKDDDSHVFTFSMCLKYLKIPGINGVMDYVEAVNKHGLSRIKSSNAKALEEFGMKATFTYSSDPEDIKKQIRAGQPVAASLLCRGTPEYPSGKTHLVAITGYGKDYWLVQDPFGKMDLINGLWSDRNPLAGKDMRYSFQDMNPRLFASGGASGWCWLNFREM